MPKSHQDQEVEVLSESSNSDKCLICPKSLQNMSVREKNEHYSNHQEGLGEGVPPTLNEPRKISLKPTSPRKRKRNGTNEKDVFWHPSQATTPPTNFTPGLITLLKKALVKAHDKGSVQKAYLCCPNAVHVETNWDKTWGCGYRNFEMACIPLMEDQRQPLYFPLIDSPIPPSVEGLQEWLEKAWEAGYDPDGAAHFKHKLAGTREWIGTADIYVAFTSRGIPSNLVDFDLQKRGPERLIQWIVDYFTQDPPKQFTVNDALRSASPVVVTDKLPIILQHNGHSRSVVGYEKLQNGSINLLMFDPSRAPKSRLRELGLSTHFASTTGAATSTDKKHKLSPKSLFKRVLRGGRDSTGAPPTKRTRSEEPEVIVIDDDDDGPNASLTKAIVLNEDDLASVLKWARVHSNTFKKPKYQILYFPMTDPLDEEQRRLRLEVTSLKIS